MSNRRYVRPLRKKGVIAAAQLQKHSTAGRLLEFRLDPFTRRVLRPFLIALMATAITIAMLVMIAIISPEQPWQAISYLAFFAALEGAYTTAWLNDPDSRAIDRTTYRVAEILVLIFIARVFSFIIFSDGLPSREDIQTYLSSPVSFALVGNFFTTLTIMMAGWWLSTTISRIFSQLDVSEAEIRFFTLPESQQKLQADERPIQIPRSDLQNSYLTIFLSVGMLLVVMAAISTYEVREFTYVSNPFEFTRLGLRPGMLTALLLYFLTGLWLLSHARLLRMNARWLMDGVAKEPKLERAWQRSSLVLLLTISFAASFLPIGSTLGISRIIGLLLQVLSLIVSAFYGLIGLIFASFLMLLTRNAEPGEQQPLQPLPTQVPPPSEPLPPPNPLFGQIASSIFWAILIAVIIASAVFILRERGYKLQTDRIQGIYAALVAWITDIWKSLRRRMRVTSRKLSRLLTIDATPSIDQSAASAKARNRFVRINSLPPRDQIRYFYLSTIKRAKESGVRRHVNQTPLEFSRDLVESWPEAEGDLDSLTNAFLEARYNSRPIEKAEVNPIKEGWKRLRNRLRTPAKNNPAG
jgi:hypothetical protein